METQLGSPNLNYVDSSNKKWLISLRFCRFKQSLARGATNIETSLKRNPYLKVSSSRTLNPFTVNS